MVYSLLFWVLQHSYHQPYGALKPRAEVASGLGLPAFGAYGVRVSRARKAHMGDSLN